MGMTSLRLYLGTMYLDLQGREAVCRFYYSGFLSPARSVYLSYELTFKLL